VKKIKFAFSVGEESGDFLGAQLINNLKKKYPEASFVGLAGNLMQKEGMESLFPIKDLSVMGLIDPLLNLNRLLRRRKQLIDFILEEQPEFFIGIDSPSFNAGIAKRIKSKTNTKTIQYVCPQFWAWRKRRASRFKNYLDHIYSIFPFEEKLLAKEDMSSSFTGHPLAEHFEIDVDKREFKSKMSLNTKKIYIALLPGSRKSELKNHLKILEKVASSYFSSNPNYHFIIALTEENPISEDRYLKKENISLIKGNTREVLKACDYAIVSSGTATLEAMLSKTPFCVIYKSNSISNFIITNLLLQLDFISLPNILANKKIVPELRQKDLKIKKVIKELNCLIENSNEEMIKEFKILHQSLINENDNKFSKIIDKLSLEF
tara:strand:- start:5646 stop:6776 length:1131 start_codon:yes stop_codon:yes gene_type:complete